MGRYNANLNILLFDLIQTIKPEDRRKLVTIKKSKHISAELINKKQINQTRLKL